MDVTTDFMLNQFAFLAGFAYFHALYWLLFGWALVVLAAFGICKFFVKPVYTPVETAVYKVWGWLFVAHLALWVYGGLDAMIQEAWWGALLPGQPFGDWGILFAILRIAPYVLVLVIDVGLIVFLFKQPKSAKAWQRPVKTVGVRKAAA